MKQLFYFLSFVILFAGCVNKNLDYFNSSIKVDEKSELNYNIIATDFVNLISPYYDHKTTFFIKTDDKNKDFYNYLVDLLRNKGYAISDSNNIKNLIFLSYLIQRSNNDILVTYNINESKINLIYTIEDGKLINTKKITSFNFGNQDE